ncbi:hypothetical protein [Clostridium botulinum]
MNEVTLILPSDISILEDKYSEALADVVVEMLTIKELEYLISEVEKKN